MLTKKTELGNCFSFFKTVNKQDIQMMKINASDLQKFSKWTKKFLLDPDHSVSDGREGTRRSLLSVRASVRHQAAMLLSIIAFFMT